jgi:murein DD-endopeptidase MepM/ murein hydrolase activator NlpD
MHYSAVAALMILTTVLLSACAQDKMAMLDDRSGNFYGRGTIANAMSRNDVFIPSFESRYVPPASVDSVSSQDLAPAAAPATAPAMQPAKPESMLAPMAPASTLSWQWPVNGTITSGFGVQREGIANEGVIIAAPKNTPIKAAAAGEVAFVGDSLRDYGNMVILRHGNGDMSSYAHAERVIVAKGMQVRQGDVIGYVGQTGRAKMPQLHFAVRSGEKAIDPLSKLPSQVASR